MSQELPSLDHVVSLSDDTGIIQHATFSVPNRSTGYCTDDIARGLIVALMRGSLVPSDRDAQRLAPIYLAFLHDAQLEDGRFHNFMSYGREWLDEVGTHDSCGRAMWSLGFAMRFAADPGQRELSMRLFDRALGCIDWLEYPRAEAYALLGLAHARHAQPRSEYRSATDMLARRSLVRLRDASTAQWYWFEDILTYDNARLPEALILAGQALGNGEAVAQGLAALDFLERIVFEDERFVAIGNDGWYRKGGPRARFAQQPLEAAAMVDAELAAFGADAKPERLAAADLAHAWFHGKNSLGLSLVAGGGCYDGLEAGGVNANMGAESTLAHLASAYALALRQKQPAGAH